MKIIGHRGAAGTESENTLQSLRSALDMGVYAIEFDVRKTKDDHLVLSHDNSLMRTAGVPDKVNSLTLEELQKIKLPNNSFIPTLSQALEVVGKKRIVIELKEEHSSSALLMVLAKFPTTHVSVASFNLNELAQLRKLAPYLEIYALERTNPFDIIYFAKRHRLNGVGFNYWLLNPLTYYLCQRVGLDIFVYTVNRPFHAKFLNTFYPHVSICSDYPERFLKQRKTRT